MTPDALSGVSRETLERLGVLAGLLERWTPRINLVSRSSVANLWARHIADSVHLHAVAPGAVAHWADLGSGGGFPGLVVAILSMESGSPGRVTLVESDHRKCAFLRTVIRETGAPATVRAARIEELPPLDARVVSARALAPLGDLLGHAERHLAAGGTGIFPKGASWQKDLEDARRQWNFTHRVDKSETEPGSVILSVQGVSRA